MKRKAVMLMLSATMMMSPMMTAIPAYCAPAGVEVQAEVNLTKENEAMLKSMFDAKFYAKMYPDVAKMSEKEMFQHFLKHGLAEGRQMCADFNVNAFRSAYKDLNAIYGKDVVSYYKFFVRNVKGNPTSPYTVTTLDAAKQKGIIVTDMRDRHVTVSADGMLLVGSAADLFIASAPEYKNAVDNIGGGLKDVVANLKEAGIPTDSLAAVSPTVAETVSTTPVTSETVQEATISSEEMAILEQVMKEVAKEETKVESAIESKPEDKKDPTPVTPQIAAKKIAAYNSALAAWEAAAPQIGPYLTPEFNAKVEAWENSMPDRNMYTVAGDDTYESQEAALLAYGADYSAWLEAMPSPEAEDLDDDAYQAALELWESQAPEIEDFGMKRINVGGDEFLVLADKLTDEAVIFDVTFKEGYCKIDNAYLQTVVDQDSAYTIVEEELNDNFGKSGETYYYSDSTVPVTDDNTTKVLKSTHAKVDVDESAVVYYAKAGAITAESFALLDASSQADYVEIDGTYYLVVSEADATNLEAKTGYIFVGDDLYDVADASDAVKVAYSKELKTEDGYVEITDAEGLTKAYKTATKTDAVATEVQKGDVVRDGLDYYQIADDSEAISDYNDEVARYEAGRPEASGYVTDDFNDRLEAWLDENPEPHASDAKYAYGSYESQTDADIDYDAEMRKWEAKQPQVQSEDYNREAYDSAVDSWNATKPTLDDFDDEGNFVGSVG